MRFTQWLVLRVTYTPLPRSSKDRLYFLTLAQLFGFCWPATGQVPGRKSARAPLHFCLPFKMQKSPLWSWPLLLGRRETCSLGFHQGIGDSYEKPDRKQAKKRTGGVYQEIGYVVHMLMSNHQLVLLFFCSVKSLKTTDAQYYNYNACSGLKPGPEIPRHWRWSVMPQFKNCRVGVT